jgi:hypothetical protein
MMRGARGIVGARGTMPPERWRQIEAIFNAALEREAATPLTSRLGIEAIAPNELIRSIHSCV